ncbi:MAG: hypothetical protein ACRC92_21570 [Peptostreptococcaceae bacterium]
MKVVKMDMEELFEKIHSIEPFRKIMEKLAKDNNVEVSCFKDLIMEGMLAKEGTELNNMAMNFITKVIPLLELVRERDEIAERQEEGHKIIEEYNKKKSRRLEDHENFDEIKRIHKEVMAQSLEVKMGLANQILTTTMKEIGQYPVMGGGDSFGKYMYLRGDVVEVVTNHLIEIGVISVEGKTKVREVKIEKDDIEQELEGRIYN